VYKVTVRTGADEVVGQFNCHSPPSELELSKLVPDNCYADICRLADDLLSDTAYFRDEVEYDLEPLDLEEL